MNLMLRGSILYACEVYYDLKEYQLRLIERIEESNVRQIFKTFRGCPISQLYLEVGQTPACFQIQKFILLFLKYILQQDEKDTLKTFFILQLEQPSLGFYMSK